MNEDDSGNSLIGVAEIIIAKHRNGATGDIHLTFKKELAKFTDMETRFQEGFSSYYGEAKTYSSKMNEDDEEESVSEGVLFNQRTDKKSNSDDDAPF